MIEEIVTVEVEITAQVTDTQGRNKYLVALQVGYFTESIIQRYKNYMIIYADSGREALEKYAVMNNCSICSCSIVKVIELGKLK